MQAGSDTIKNNFLAVLRTLDGNQLARFGMPADGQAKNEVKRARRALHYTAQAGRRQGQAAKKFFLNGEDSRLPASPALGSDLKFVRVDYNCRISLERCTH